MTYVALADAVAVFLSEEVAGGVSAVPSRSICLGKLLGTVLHCLYGLIYVLKLALIKGHSLGFRSFAEDEHALDLSLGLIHKILIPALGLVKAAGLRSEAGERGIARAESELSEIARAVRAEGIDIIVLYIGDKIGHFAAVHSVMRGLGCSFDARHPCGKAPKRNARKKQNCTRDNAYAGQQFRFVGAVLFAELGRIGNDRTGSFVS